ncbi:MAG: pilus assembly protein [Pirellulales bacterium]|nr:pilus assembly protein [Pirellulales bacterium]
MTTRNYRILRAQRRSSPAIVGRRRSGAAVVELAVLLPLLVLCFVLAVDFARVFYFSLTLMNCARAGALYAYDPIAAAESPFPTVRAAALADATNLDPQPQITQTNGFDAGRSYVDVTAAYTFTPVAAIPPIPRQVNLTRTVRMYVAGNTPYSN